MYGYDAWNHNLVGSNYDGSSASRRRRADAADQQWLTCAANLYIESLRSPFARLAASIASGKITAPAFTGSLEYRPTCDAAKNL